MLTGCRAWDVIQCLRKLAEEAGWAPLSAALARCDAILHAHPYSTRAFYGSRLNRLKLRALHGATESHIQPVVHVSLLCRSLHRCQSNRISYEDESTREQEWKQEKFIMRSIIRRIIISVNIIITIINIGIDSCDVLKNESYYEIQFSSALCLADSRGLSKSFMSALRTSDVN